MWVDFLETGISCGNNSSYTVRDYLSCSIFWYYCVFSTAVVNQLVVLPLFQRNLPHTSAV